jgi:hypothetical protein
MFYGQNGNESLAIMFSGLSRNISIEEIYGVDYNSSINKFSIQTGDSWANMTTTIKVTLEELTGLGGSWSSPSGLLRLSLLSGDNELCVTFFFLLDGGVKEYSLSLTMYAEPKRLVSMSGYMSLPNQARNFDKFKLFPYTSIPDKKMTFMEFSITSLKFLQKRNTVADPCIHIDNYDKVHKYLFR